MLPHSISLRLARKIKVDPSGCWLWTAYKTQNGYGQFSIEGRGRYVHRVTYVNRYGPVPKGLTLDHLCRTRHCVNPDHLEPVTNTENVLRGEGWAAKNARKTHCLQGHEFTASNTYVSWGRRNCRVCKLTRNRAGYWRKRAARRPSDLELVERVVQ